MAAVKTSHLLIFTRQFSSMIASRLQLVDILNNLALTASNLYSKNLFNFINNLYDKEKKDIYINKEDEIISKTLIDKK